MAELAEVKKDQKYSLLGATYFFTPVAIETSGAIGPRSSFFLRGLERRVRWESGEPRATCYLLQRLSVAVQRGNAAVILDSNNFYFIIINIFLLFIHLFLH